MKAAAITGAMALERIQDEPGAVREVRVSRKCPQCHKRAMQRGNAGGVCHQFVCVKCGHSWIGLVKKAEL